MEVKRCRPTYDKYATRFEKAQWFLNTIGLIDKGKISLKEFKIELSKMVGIPRGMDEYVVQMKSWGLIRIEKEGKDEFVFDVRQP